MNWDIDFDRRFQIGMDIWSHSSVRTDDGLLERVKVIGSSNAPKGLVARLVIPPTVEAKKRGKKNYYYLFYPTVIDLAHFAQKSRHLVAMGPAERFPGSVGGILVEEEERSRRPKRLIIEFLQGNFKTQKGNQPGVSRKLATKYGGWSVHLFDEIQEQAAAQKATIHYPFETAKPGNEAFLGKVGQAKLKKVELIRKQALRRQSRVRQLARNSEGLLKERHRLVIRPRVIK